MPVAFLVLQVDKQQLRALNIVDRILQEIDIHRGLTHPHIARLHHCFEDEQRIYLVLELCARGDVLSFLKGQAHARGVAAHEPSRDSDGSGVRASFPPRAPSPSPVAPHLDLDTRSFSATTASAALIRQSAPAVAWLTSAARSDTEFSHTSGLDERLVRSFLIDVLAALVYLHAHHIVHRDLKLANLLLTDDLRIKLCDFGLAARLDSAVSLLLHLIVYLRMRIYRSCSSLRGITD
jgi:serine/threonine protein kinase